MENNFLKAQAEIARDEYRLGIIDRSEAKERIQPFLNAVNDKSVEIAKKYNQKPRKVNLNAYLR